MSAFPPLLKAHQSSEMPCGLDLRVLSITQLMALKKYEATALFMRPHRKRPLQRCQHSLRRLPPAQDPLDDVRREQGQPQHATNVKLVDLLGSGDLRDGRVFAILQHLPPAGMPGRSL